MTPPSHTPPLHREPLSPELVLVDPALAAEARALLSELPWLERVRPAEETAARAAPTVPVDLASSTPVPVPPVTVRSGRPRARTAGAALAGAVVVALALDLVPAGGPQPVLEAERERSVTRLLPTRDAAAATPQRSRSTAPERAAHETPRTFVWPKTRGASGYEFQLFRGTDLVFRARTTAPRLSMPLRWKRAGRSESLRRGTYRWNVWPVGRGDRRPAARAVVQAELVVTS